jgi:uncharacterized protein with PIN domain
MIVDTSALIAIAWDEPERARFEDAIEADPVRLVSAASVLERAIVMMRRTGPPQARRQLPGSTNCSTSSGSRSSRSPPARSASPKARI